MNTSVEQPFDFDQFEDTSCYAFIGEKNDSIEESEELSPKVVAQLEQWKQQGCPEYPSLKEKIISYL